LIKSCASGFFICAGETPVKRVINEKTGKPVESEKAICFLINGEESWMPKSQIKSMDEVGDGIDIEITDWIAQQKGLTGDAPKKQTNRNTGSSEFDDGGVEFPF